MRSTGPPRSSGSRWRTLVRSRTVTRGSSRSDHASWPRPTSTATTCAAPAWSRQSVNPPVEAPASRARRPRTVDREALERGGELLAPAGHEPGRVAGDLDGLVGGRPGGPARGAGLPPTSTRPAAMASTAWRRLPSSPRRTSSASSRRRTVTAAEYAVRSCAQRLRSGWGRARRDRRRRTAAAGRGSPRRPGARPPRSRPTARARTATRARSASAPSVDGRSPTMTPVVAEALADDPDRRRLGLARHLGGRAGGGRDRGDDRARARDQPARDRVGGVEVGGDEAGAVAHRRAMPGRGRRSRSRGGSRRPPPRRGRRRPRRARRRPAPRARRARRTRAPGRPGASECCEQPRRGHGAGDDVVGVGRDPHAVELGDHVADRRARVVRHERHPQPGVAQRGDAAGRGRDGSSPRQTTPSRSQATTAGDVTGGVVVGAVIGRSRVLGDPGQRGAVVGLVGPHGHRQLQVPAGAEPSPGRRGTARARSGRSR